MLKFSPSRYNIQSECLGRYYFTYIMNRRDNTLWPGTIAGTATHSYLEENLNNINSENDLKKLPLWKPYFDKALSNEITKGMNYKKPRGFSDANFISNYEKFVREVLRFLYLYLPKGTKIFEEKISEIINIDNIDIEITGVVDLQVKNNDETYIVDFKTTKNNNTWYFVDWKDDAQSLSYFYLLRERNPHSFVYTIFNFEQKTIITQFSDEIEKEQLQKSFYGLLQDFVVNHNNSSNNNNYNPSKENCKWCFHKTYCKVAIS
jgi:hypothetical protein